MMLLYRVLRRSFLMIAFSTLTMLYACENNVSEKETVFEKELITPTKSLQNATDTFTRTGEIAVDKYSVPFKITWVASLASDSCYKISYIKLEQLPAEEAFKIEDVTTDAVPCGTHWESEDERRFETIVISAKITKKKGVKAITREGNICTINVIGELKIE